MLRYFITCLLLTTILWSIIVPNNASIFSEIDDIIPHDLDVSTAVQLTIRYKTKTVTPGDLVRPHKMHKTPNAFWQIKCGYFYHLLMYDGDTHTPTNHSLGFFKHWLSVNIPGNNLKSSETIAVYSGGLPQRNTGIHRYVFLLFESPSSVVFDEPKSMTDLDSNRYHFNISQFCQKYGLLKVVAINYLKSEWESYVDTYLKLITI